MEDKFDKLAEMLRAASRSGKSIDFHIEIAPENQTRRNLALISLNPGFTSYLQSVDERARPIDLPIMSFYKDKGGFFRDPTYFFALKEGWKQRAKDFAYNFERKFPNTEQVYVLSKCGKQVEVVDIEEEISAPSKLLESALSDIIFKRFLIIPYFGNSETHVVLENWCSSEAEIKRAIVDSLEFSSR